ncbi:MAG: carboxymuconolactone decarboxylase family protein [Kiloniellales bacterium]|nr:carboxymuconolactone decarboxylase family protein [Kiloniellales bacterium]
MARIAPVETASPEADKREALEMVKGQWGALWNVTSTIAHNPKIIEGFLAFWQAIDQSGLSKADREVICMEMARLNGCHYCIPAHRAVSRMAGIDTQMMERIAQGDTLEGEGRATLIQRLTRRLTETRGALEDDELQSFQASGISVPEMIAVIAEIAHCTVTNFTNRLAGTDLDPHLEAFRHGQPESLPNMGSDFGPANS